MGAKYYETTIKYSYLTYIILYSFISEEELEDLRNQLENLKKQLKTEETEHYYEGIVFIIKFYLISIK